MNRPADLRESNRAVALLLGWAPFIVVLLAYELMRDLASTLRVPPHNLSGVERALFGGYEPTLVLQAAIAKLGDADLIDDIGGLVYSAHFLCPSPTSSEASCTPWSLWSSCRSGPRVAGET